GASEVYLHEMPGGQFTNLKEQARALGLSERWHEVARTYADVNRLFGDIVKVTPSSKIVGDMALSMVSAGLSCEEVTDPDREIAFPDSVISFFKGEIGQPPGGFPEALQRKVLKDQKALHKRPGAYMPPQDLAAARREAESAAGRELSDFELDSYLMYPKVFVDYARHYAEYGPVDVLPSKVFFYGMQPREEIAIDLEPGKTLIIRCQAIGEINEQAEVRVFFELNGQPRTAKVKHRVAAQAIEQRPKADPANPGHVMAPMPGMVSTVAVREGQSVASGDVLLTVEAMKMETSVLAEHDGVVARLYTPAGTQIDAKDLLLELTL
ncbi:MAG: biotin/lipoyl-binding protein, partial [Gammaproteobacteria bacterium]|nr:biotin/lipoyl-binding protein [Gammaproteobacteria bacterium]